MNTKQTTPAALAPKTEKLALIQFEKTLGDSVQNRVTELSKQGRLNLPANYSIGNALQSAWLKILQTKDRNQKPVLDVCTKESVANSLLDMAILGLNPSKSQGYFIPYGEKLAWFTSYLGKAAALKRIKGIETEPIATVIYAGDELALSHNELGEEIVLEHKTSWENKIKNDLIGVYATVIYNGVKRSAVLTLAECKEAWTKSQTNKEHVDFRSEYMKRTAINRLSKMILNTTNDDDLLAETIIQNENQHYDFEPEVITEEKAKLEVAQKANSGEVVDVEPEPQPEATPEPQPSPAPAQQEKPATARPF